MAIQAILVPTSGDDSLQNVLEAALIVARRFKAHITVLHVSRGNKNQSEVETELAEDIGSRVNTFARQRKLKITDTALKDPGVTISFHHEIGKVNDILIHWSRLFDTTAVMRPGYKGSFLRRKMSKSYNESVMMMSGRPVLLVPPQWEVHKAQHAVVAWNHSLEVSRALAMTLPWLVQMRKVTVVVPRRLLSSGEQVVDYLAWHGAKAEVKILNRRTSSAGKRLLKICDTEKADFLVMGGYSHSRVSERVFGGVTQYVLENSNIITVMVH